MIFNRTWAMPNRHTFLIPPIRQLLDGLIEPPLLRRDLWIDPFAGHHSPLSETNDINPACPTKHHLPAHEFVRLYNGIRGVLFDPPYSPRQFAEHYEAAGIKPTRQHTQNARYLAALKNDLATRMMPGATAVCFGWNSNGFGKVRGFELKGILLVSHGGAHHDTIVTVETKKGC